MENNPNVVRTPAWCDPQRRNVIWNWTNVLVGVLQLDTERFVFVSTTGEAIETAREDASIEWRREESKWRTATFDLHAKAQSYRFYLSQPARAAPAFEPGKMAEIGEQLESWSVLKFLGEGSPRELGEAFELLSGALSLPHAISEFKEGKRAAERMKALWG
jgi:hypothetical protein